MCVLILIVVDIRTKEQIFLSNDIAVDPILESSSYPLPAQRRYSPYLKGRAPFGVVSHYLYQVKASESKIVFTY